MLSESFCQTDISQSKTDISQLKTGISQIGRSVKPHGSERELFFSRVLIIDRQFTKGLVSIFDLGEKEEKKSFAAIRFDTGVGPRGTAVAT